MKFKRMMLVTFVLLAILTLGAVSASDDVDVVAANDAGTGDVALEESPDAADANVIESQGQTGLDDAVGDGKPIAFEDVKINNDVGRDYPAVGGGADENDHVVVLEVPSHANGTVVITSGNQEFFNKELKDFADNSGPIDESVNWYGVSSKDVNFFTGLQSEDMVKVSLFENENQIASRLYKIYFENDRFRLDDGFSVYIRGEDDSRGPIFIDTNDSVVSINVWSPGFTGTFHVIVNGTEYKYRPNYDENGNAWHDWTLSSFGITQLGDYNVTVTYGTEDDRGDVIGKGVFSVISDYNQARAYTDEVKNELRFYVPSERFNGRLCIYVKPDYEEEFDWDHPVINDTVASNVYWDRWTVWTFNDLGCEFDNGYTVRMNVVDEGVECFYYENNFWYGGHWEGDVPNQTTMTVNNELWNDDDNVLDIYIPERAFVYGGNLTIKSGTTTLYKTTEINHWQMNFDNKNRFYQFSLPLSELTIDKNMKNNDLVTFTFTYYDYGTQKTIKRMAFFEKDGDCTRFNSFVWIRDSYDSRGPLYLDTIDSVVSIDVWTPGINDIFYVSANGKEYKYKVNYNLDENGGSRRWVLSSFGITEPGLYPVTVTYGKDDDHSAILAQYILNVVTFNYDTFRVISYVNSDLINLYCPDNAKGNVSIFVRPQDGSDYPELPVQTHVISADDYNKWINWTFDELGFSVDNGYDVRIVINNEYGQFYYYEDGFWYGEHHWTADYLSNQTTMTIYNEFWGDDDWVLEIAAPENSSFTNGTLRITSRLGSIFPRAIRYWEMEMDEGDRVYQYHLRFKDIKNKANLKNLKKNDVITFTFTYDDNGTQKTIEKIAFYEKDDDCTRFNSFVNFWDSSYDGPLYLDSNRTFVSLDVWSEGITGTFYVCANGTEYKYRVNYDLDENGGNHGWSLSSFGITEPGLYPVTVTYGTEDDHGAILDERIFNVTVFNYDTFRAIVYKKDHSITFYCPENAEGTISIFVRNEESEDDEYPSKAAVTHVIDAGDYNRWINWTFEDLGCELDNGYWVMFKVTKNNMEIYSYEDGFWYSDDYPEYVPNQVSVELRSVVVWDEFDERVVEIYIPESSFVYGGNLTIKSATKTVFSKSINHWEMDFDNENRFYEYSVLFEDLNLKGLSEAVLTYNFTYTENGVQKTITKLGFFETVFDEDRDDKGFSFDFVNLIDANVLEDEIALLISDFPDYFDDEFNITINPWNDNAVTTWKISDLTRNEEGFYAWKCSDLGLDKFEFYPDEWYDLHIDFYKDGEEYENYDYSGKIYNNPAINHDEIALDDDENYVIIFVKKPTVDEEFIIFVKKDGADFTNKTLTLSQLDDYWDEEEEWYSIRPDDLGINETGSYEITINFTRNGAPISYSSTFDVVDFVIGVRYSDKINRIADDINTPIFIINLPDHSDGRVILVVNGTERINKTLDEVGFSHWNRMGAYYIPLNYLNATESGKYNVNLTVISGNSSRSVVTNVTVEVSPNTYAVHDGIYFVADENTLFDFRFGTPIGHDTVITLYLNGDIVAQGAAGPTCDIYTEAPTFDKFRDELGVFKPGTYVARLVIGNETVFEDSFRILTKSGNVNITLSGTNIMTVDHLNVQVSALRPANYSDSDFILVISLDPDFENDDGPDYAVHDLQGMVWYDASTKKFDLSTLSVGKHIVLVTYYAEDEEHMMDTDFFAKKFTVNVKKTSTVINAPTSVATFYKVAKKIVVTLKDARGKAIAKKKVTVKVGTISKTLTTNSKGQVSIDISGLIPKSYYAYFKFAGDSIYSASPNKKVKVTVKKAAPKILAPAKAFKVNVKVKKFTATLKDNKGKIIKNAKLTLRINGKNFIAKTNSKGVATFKVNNLVKKANFKGIVKFAGNKYYKALNKAVIIRAN
jgi:hypothetical protein